MNQTIVRQDLRFAVAGELFDSGFHDIISKAAEGAIKFGTGVVPGTDPETQTKTPSAAVVDFAGVAARDNKEQQFVPTLGENEYDDEDTVGILQSGRIWVDIAETVAIGDAVQLWFDAGVAVAGAVAGQFGMTVDALDNTPITAGARWFRGGTATEGIAVLQLGEWPNFTP